MEDAISEQESSQVKREDDKINYKVALHLEERKIKEKQVCTGFELGLIKVWHSDLPTKLTNPIVPFFHI